MTFGEGHLEVRPGMKGVMWEEQRARAYSFCWRGKAKGSHEGGNLCKQ